LNEVTGGIINAVERRHRFQPLPKVILGVFAREFLGHDLTDPEGYHLGDDFGLWGFT
jgi:hypothetical protein